jgi:ribosomal protein L37AE/L43A
MSEILGLDILAMRKACEEMPPYQRSDCPVCGFQLETAVDGIIHCRYCGWADSYPLKRDVPRV